MTVQQSELTRAELESFADESKKGLSVLRYERC